MLPARTALPLLSELRMHTIAFVTDRRPSAAVGLAVRFNPAVLVPPPVTVFVVVLSGLRHDTAESVVAPTFNALTSTVCSLSFSSCSALTRWGSAWLRSAWLTARSPRGIEGAVIEWTVPSQDVAPLRSV